MVAYRRACGRARVAVASWLVKDVLTSRLPRSKPLSLMLLCTQGPEMSGIRPGHGRRSSGFEDNDLHMSGGGRHWAGPRNGDTAQSVSLGQPHGPGG